MSRDPQTAESVAGFSLGSRKDKPHAADGWTSPRDAWPPLRQMPPRGSCGFVAVTDPRETK